MTLLGTDRAPVIDYQDDSVAVIRHDARTLRWI